MRFYTVSDGTTLNASNMLSECLDSFDKCKSNCEVRQNNNGKLTTMYKKQAKGTRLELIARLK